MLWEALDIAQLTPVVEALPGGLGETSGTSPFFAHLLASELFSLRTQGKKRKKKTDRKIQGQN